MQSSSQDSLGSAMGSSSIDSTTTSLSSASSSAGGDYVTLASPHWLIALIAYVSQHPALIAAYTTRISPRSPGASAVVAQRSVSPTETYELLNGFNKRINGPGVLVLQAMCNQFEQAHQRFHAQLSELAVHSHTDSWPMGERDRTLIADLVDQGNTHVAAWHDAVWLAGKGTTWAAAWVAASRASPNTAAALTASALAMASAEADDGAAAPSSSVMAPAASETSLSSAGSASNDLEMQGTATRARSVSPTESTSDDEDGQVEASTGALRRSSRPSAPSRNRLPRSLTMALAEAHSDTKAGARKRRRGATATPRPRTSASPARTTRTPRRPSTALAERQKAAAQTQTPAQAPQAQAQAANSASGSSPGMPSGSSVSTDPTSLFSSPARPSSIPFAGIGSGGSTISQRLLQLEDLLVRQSKQIEDLQAQRTHNDRQVLNAIGEVHAAHEAERERRKAHEAEAEKRAEERNAVVLQALARLEQQQSLLKTEVDSMHSHLIEHL